MAESKYGRLFTEADVEKLLRVQHDRTWTAAKHDEWEDAPAPRPEEYRPLPVSEAVGWAEGDYGFTLTFPADEPLFLLRGQDAYAPSAVSDYLHSLNTALEHRLAVERAADRMIEWQQANPDRVKVPG